MLVVHWLQNKQGQMHKQQQQQQLSRTRSTTSASASSMRPALQYANTMALTVLGPEVEGTAWVTTPAPSLATCSSCSRSRRREASTLGSILIAATYSVVCTASRLALGARVSKKLQARV